MMSTGSRTTVIRLSLHLGPDKDVILEVQPDENIEQVAKRVVQEYHLPMAAMEPIHARIEAAAAQHSTPPITSTSIPSNDQTNESNGIIQSYAVPSHRRSQSDLQSLQNTNVTSTRASLLARTSSAEVTSSSNILPLKRNVRENKPHTTPKLNALDAIVGHDNVADDESQRQDEKSLNSQSRVSAIDDESRMNMYNDLRSQFSTTGQRKMNSTRKIGSHRNSKKNVLKSAQSNSDRNVLRSTQSVGQPEHSSTSRQPIARSMRASSLSEAGLSASFHPTSSTTTTTTGSKQSNMLTKNSVHGKECASTTQSKQSEEQQRDRLHIRQQDQAATQQKHNSTQPLEYYDESIENKAHAQRIETQPALEHQTDRYATRSVSPSLPPDAQDLSMRMSSVSEDAISRAMNIDELDTSIPIEESALNSSNQEKPIFPRPQSNTAGGNNQSTQHISDDAQTAPKSSIGSNISSNKAPSSDPSYVQTGANTTSSENHTGLTQSDTAIQPNTNDVHTSTPSVNGYTEEQIKKDRNATIRQHDTNEQTNASMTSGIESADTSLEKTHSAHEQAFKEAFAAAKQGRNITVTNESSMANDTTRSSTKAKSIRPSLDGSLHQSHLDNNATTRFSNNRSISRHSRTRSSDTMNRGQSTMRISSQALEHSERLYKQAQQIQERQAQRAIQYRAEAAIKEEWICPQCGASNTAVDFVCLERSKTGNAIRNLETGEIAIITPDIKAQLSQTGEVDAKSTLRQDMNRNVLETSSIPSDLNSSKLIQLDSKQIRRIVKILRHAHRIQHKDMNDNIQTNIDKDSTTSSFKFLDASDVMTIVKQWERICGTPKPPLFQTKVTDSSEHAVFRLERVNRMVENARHRKALDERERTRAIVSREEKELAECSFRPTLSSKTEKLAKARRHAMQEQYKEQLKQQSQTVTESAKLIQKDTCVTGTSNNVSSMMSLQQTPSDGTVSTRITNQPVSNQPISSQTTRDNITGEKTTTVQPYTLYNRLYQDAVVRHQRIRSHAYETPIDCTFAPQIAPTSRAIVRDGKASIADRDVASRLYEEATLREERHKNAMKQATEYDFITGARMFQPMTNKQTSKVQQNTLKDGNSNGKSNTNSIFTRIQERGQTTLKQRQQKIDAIRRAEQKQRSQSHVNKKSAAILASMRQRSAQHLFVVLHRTCTITQDTRKEIEQVLNQFSSMQLPQSKSTSTTSTASTDLAADATHVLGILQQINAPVSEEEASEIIKKPLSIEDIWLQALSAPIARVLEVVLAQNSTTTDKNENTISFSQFAKQMETVLGKYTWQDAQYDSQGLDSAYTLLRGRTATWSMLRRSQWEDEDEIESTFQPMTNSRSEKLAASTRNSNDAMNVHERLYAAHKLYTDNLQRAAEAIDQERSSDNTFKPTLNKKLPRYLQSRQVMSPVRAIVRNIHNTVSTSTVMTRPLQPSSTVQNDAIKEIDSSVSSQSIPITELSFNTNESVSPDITIQDSSKTTSTSTSSGNNNTSSSTSTNSSSSSTSSISSTTSTVDEQTTNVYTTKSFISPYQISPVTEESESSRSHTSGQSSSNSISPIASSPVSDTYQNEIRPVNVQNSVFSAVNIKPQAQSSITVSKTDSTNSTQPKIETTMTPTSSTIPAATMQRRLSAAAATSGTDKRFLSDLVFEDDTNEDDLSNIADLRLA